MKGAFPILERELQIRSRRPSLWWLRFAGGSVAMLAALVACLFEAELRAARMPMGRALFVLGSGVSALTLIVGAVVMVSDAIGAEHREGTLGLLLLAPRSAFEVVCSKLACAAIVSLSFAAATLPVVGVGVFLGGVRGGALAMLFPALAVLVLFSHSMTLLASSIAVRATSAICLSLGLIFLPTVFAVGWYGLFRSAPPDGLLMLNPFYPSAYCWGVFSWLPTGFPGSSLVLLTTVSLAALWFASWRVRQLVRCSGNRKSEAPKARTNMASATRLIGGTGSFFGLSPALVWLAFSVSSLFLLLNFFGVAFGEASVPVFLAGLAASLWTKWRLLLGGARLLETERESRMLELLLTTPAPAKLILPALMRAMRQPLYSDMLLATVLLFWGAVGFGLSNTGAEKSAAWLGFSLIGLLWLDFLSLPWVGLWRGLRASTPAKAMIQAAACAQIIPTVQAIPAFWILLIADIALFDEPTPRLGWVGSLAWAGAVTVCIAGWARMRCFQTFRGAGPAVN